ncbi:hypothetical protein F5148DRAFT_1151705 [Russula earlei]|uniref:Uncharacterized protein n=1 Tax=Russula earlei TaxID=71964 RepID=A0ACC0U0V9_9AGAM|nr:hypothetical protein F5148DRAFT_1151705 [Russula earlei]
MGELGLESFDYSTFDPTLPASWEALGQAWAVTNGRPPSQEELMMYVMEVTVKHGKPGALRWMGEARGASPRGGRGRGAFGTRGGRGGFGYGNSGGEGQARWDYGGDAYANSTDAIVLGEHTNASNGIDWVQDEQAQGSLGEEGEGQGENQGAAGGRMQKVGDNWVFTRNDGSAET